MRLIAVLAFLFIALFVKNYADEADIWVAAHEGDKKSFIEYAEDIKNNGNSDPLSEDFRNETLERLLMFYCVYKSKDAKELEKEEKSLDTFFEEFSKKAYYHLMMQ